MSGNRETGKQVTNDNRPQARGKYTTDGKRGQTMASAGNQAIDDKRGENVTNSKCVKCVSYRMRRKACESQITFCT